MKSKDITQKMLERYNDVFADIVNVLLHIMFDIHGIEYMLKG
mgnify:FL=1